MALAIERGRAGKTIGRAAVAAVAALLLLSSLLPLLFGPATAVARDRDRPRANGVESIVILPAGADPVAAAAELGVVPRHVYRGVFTGFAADLPPAAVSAARASRSARQIEPDGFVRIQGTPVDAVGKNRKKRPKKVSPQRYPTGVRRIATPLPAEPGTAPPVDVDVAVLDTGVDKVRDLTVVGGTSCQKGGPRKDRNGHGTHVAGTVGALDNNRDVVGVAPGARIWAVKVLDDGGSGRWSDVVCGLDWVYQNRATIDVVNMSLAGDGKDEGACKGALHTAICAIVNDAGIPVVVAAGNQGGDVAKRIPAAYPEVVTVAAFADSNGLPPADGVGPKTCDRTSDDVFWFSSNSGDAVDISAPGSCIASLRLDRGVIRYSGTSMATPHVTGALARFLAENPGATVADARSWLDNEASIAPDDADYAKFGLRDASGERVLWFGRAP